MHTNLLNKMTNYLQDRFVFLTLISLSILATNCSVLRPNVGNLLVIVNSQYLWPISGAEVWLYLDEGPGGPNLTPQVIANYRSEVTDENGKALFRNVEPGRYWYMVQLEGYYTIDEGCYIQKRHTLNKEVILLKIEPPDLDINCHSFISHPG